MRVAAATALSRLGVAARASVPALVSAWRGKPSDRFEDILQTGVISNPSLDGEERPKVPVPSPFDFLNKPEEDVRKATADALQRIDPKAAALLGAR